MMRKSWDTFIPTACDARPSSRFLHGVRHRLHSSSLLGVVASVSARAQHGRTQDRTARSAVSSSLAADGDAIAFCLDSAIADLSYLTISVAYRAAQELWPDRVVGPVGLYVDKAKAILPALAEAHHAVVLVRLLADEGVIGARSTAGREGPVVGRAVRNTGSRPLLVAEIAEHWPVVMDSCLLRWSLEGGAQDRTRGPPSSSTSSGSSRVGTSSRAAEGNKDGMSGRRGSSRDDLLAQARAAFQTAQYGLLEDADAVEACLSRIKPYYIAVEALKGCSRSPLMLASTLPAELGARVLGRCGLVSPAAASLAGVDLICEPSWGRVVAQLVGRAAAGCSRIQLVTGNLARLEQLVEGGGWEELDGSPPGELPAAGCQDTAVRTTSAGSASAGAVGTAGMEAEGRRQAAVKASGSAADNGSGWLETRSPGTKGGDVASAELIGSVREPQLCFSGRSGGVEVSAAAAAGGRPWGRDGSSGVSAAAAAPPALSRSCPAESGGERSQESSGQTNFDTPRPMSSSTAPLGESETPLRSAEALGPPAACSSGGDRCPPVAACSTGEQGLPPRGEEAWIDNNPTNRAVSPGAAAAVGIGDSDVGADGSGGGSSTWPWNTLRVVHLAEWSCASMSFRARALSHQPRTSLLSEHQLAEWLGVTHLDVVMDGVAWR